MKNTMIDVVKNGGEKNRDNKNIDRSLQDPSALIMDYCPSCYETLREGATDCSNCGVVVEHFQRLATEKRLKLTIGGLYHLTSAECMELESAWAKIESVYYDSQLHNQFLLLCFRLKSLPYAVKKYNDRLLKDSLDDIAATMKNRAMMLASESLPGKAIASDWVPPILAQALLRTMIVILVMGVCAGSVMMLFSVLTAQKFFFLGMGFFTTVSCLLCYIFLQRLQHSIN